MIVVNYSEFRKNLKTVLDKTIMDHETVIVSRSNNRNVVLISIQEYNSWMETRYLLRGVKTVNVCRNLLGISMPGFLNFITLLNKHIQLKF